MQQNEGTPAGYAIPDPPIPFADTSAAEKWSRMEQRMGHPFLQSLRGVKKGTLRIYLPDSSEVFYLGADPGFHATMRFADWNSMDRIAAEGSLALGEDFAAGLWETTDLKRLLRFAEHNAGTFDGLPGAKPLSRLARLARSKIFARPFGRARRKIRLRQKPGNAFYAAWLDSTMSFSCALFHGDADVPLEEAQRAKYRRILGKLDPQRGEHILDLGCGWGAFMEEAARIGVRTTGVTLDAEQAAFAKERLAGFAGLSDIRLDDYQRVKGQYDDIVSLGMFEQLGEESWPGYMACVFRNLRPGGRAMVQTAIIREDLFEDYRDTMDFARAHMTPGGMLPSRRRFEQEARRAGLLINDVYHFGRDQAITLDRWHDRLEAAQDALISQGYCGNLIRQWRFHFAASAAMFESRRLDVIQVELSKPRSV